MCGLTLRSVSLAKGVDDENLVIAETGLTTAADVQSGGALDLL